MSRAPIRRRRWEIAPQDDDAHEIGGAPLLSDGIEVSRAFVEAGRPVPSWRRGE